MVLIHSFKYLDPTKGMVALEHTYILKHGIGNVCFSGFTSNVGR